jgi:hypothetical protein
MSEIPGSIPVTGILAPTDSTDTYPVYDPIYGIDGLRSVQNNIARNDIPRDRRRHGMVVYTQSDGKYWVLNPSPWAGTDADWTELIMGASGSGNISPGGAQAVITKAIGSNTAAVLEYVAAYSTNARAGVIVAVINGSITKYNEVCTTDIGTTNDIQFSVGISGADLILYAQSTSYTWVVKTIARFI